MSYRKKRNKAIYWACLLFYIVALSALMVFLLKTVWDFSVRYEESVEDDVLEAYIDQLSSDLWEQGLGETMAAMEHEFQTNEECKEVVMEMLNGEIGYVYAPSNDPELSAYSLRSGGSSFGTVYLKKDETKDSSFEVLGKKLELPWDLRPWLVAKQEFDLSGLYTSVQVTIPSTYSVQINGHTLGPEYVIEEGIKFDSLADYYDVNPSLPTKTTYRADNIIGQLSPVIYDEDGQEFTIDTEKDDSQFIKPCDEEKRARLDQFCEDFVEIYLRYSSSVMGAGSANGYATLTNYVLPGGELDKRLLEALDGLMSWSHTNAFRIDGYQLLEAIDLGGGFYVCRVEATTTSVTDAHGENQDVTNLEILVVENNGDYRAVSLV